MRTCPTCRHDYADDVQMCPVDKTPLPIPFIATQFTPAGFSGRYQIVRQLGAGGMGTVFLAEQVNLGNRPVAIKVLRHRLLDDPEFLLRFRDEAASTARIRHPNVVTVYESGQADDASPYIAMEYLEGETLRQTLQRHGALALQACAEILQQIARGLNAAHRIGIVHRDLKPDNVFLTHDDDGKPVAKIVDFGIAKMRESTTHTMTGLTVGTPAYMSVEQAAGMRSDELDGRSDIYSLGVVVYEMVTGRVPFSADTPLAYVRKHLSEPPAPPRSIRPDLAIPAGVEAVIMKALAKNREERYRTATEFAGEFAAAITPVPVAEVVTTTAPRRGIGKRMAVAVAALVLAALAVGITWWVRGNPQPEAAVIPEASVPQISAANPAKTDAPAPFAPTETPTAGAEQTLAESASSTDSWGATKPVPRRIEFGRGESSATVEGSLAPGAQDFYTIKANAEQLMIVSVASSEGSAVFSVRTPSGQYLPHAANDSSGTDWSTRLPERGDYVIEVSCTGANAKYVLNVAIQ